MVDLIGRVLKLFYRRSGPAQEKPAIVLNTDYLRRLAKLRDGSGKPIDDYITIEVQVAGSSGSVKTVLYKSTMEGWGAQVLGPADSLGYPDIEAALGQIMDAEKRYRGEKSVFIPRARDVPLGKVADYIDAIPNAQIGKILLADYTPKQLRTSINRILQGG